MRVIQLSRHKKIPAFQGRDFNHQINQNYSAGGAVFSVGSSFFQ